MGKNSGRGKSVGKALKLEVIDKKRQRLLPLLREFKNEFYLAGGTGLALQLGHRESVDFDFFSTEKFDPSKLERKALTLFTGYKTTIDQLEADTLSIMLDDEVKISFFNIEHKAILPFINNEYLQLCNELEIGAMKIAALLRAAYRDYVDIYFLLKKYSVKDIMNLCLRKYPSFETSVYLKALLSYNDIEVVPIKYIPGFQKEPGEIFSSIYKQTKTYIDEHI